MVSGNPYKFMIRRGNEEHIIRIWKTPNKQEAIARMGSQQAIFEFTKEGAVFIAGDKFSREFEDRIKDAIMQYFFNTRIHK